MTIPHPENPQHVENLATIELLKRQGFKGQDASLSESLFEYGLAWRDLGDELLFIYRHPSRVNTFDRATLPKNLDVRREYDWVKWGELMSFIGVSLEEWLALPIECKIADLLSYYGPEEIFGSSYWEGFRIAE